MHSFRDLLRTSEKCQDKNKGDKTGKSELPFLGMTHRFERKIYTKEDNKKVGIPELLPLIATHCHTDTHFTVTCKFN